MTMNDSDLAALTPRVAVDPELPDETRAFLCRLDPLALYSSSEPAPDIQTPGFLYAAARPLAKVVGTALGTAALSFLFAVLYSDLVGMSYWDTLRSLLWGVAVLGLLGFWGVVAVANQRQADHQRPARLLKEAHGRYLGPNEFMPDAAAALARTQAAVDSILDAEVQKHGLLNQDLNAKSLPAFEWGVAQSLATYSHEVKGLPAWPAGGRAAKILSAAHQGLARRLEGIVARVGRLEEYAKTVTEAEQLHKELMQLRGISDREGSSEEVLGLMARDAEAGVVSALDQAVAAARSVGATLLTKDS
ncbi:hypothetical protein OHA38_43400 (plasmid) [Streptomyces sp. NBC_01732]|uniref:hypothetical protein n=1 Tax=Streptomyces sp. NBC_01732 TaxID=2975926 RepID=UPI00352F57F0|nr:hypothetical protein OHA38_43400 [Streptomyces sp. NBC_01732]